LAKRELNHDRLSKLDLDEVRPEVAVGAESPSLEDIPLDTTADPVEGYRRFASLWRLMGEVAPLERTFSNGLMLMLDALDDPRPLIRLVARSWLRESLAAAPGRVFDPLFAILLSDQIVQNELYVYTTAEI
jgi:hypothetical protein